MTNLLLPNKVTWIVDLTKEEDLLFPSKVLHRFVREQYAEHVHIELLDSDKIESLFSPLYSRLMMSRADFRLDKAVTQAHIHRMSQDSTYGLVWFTGSTSGAVLGGVVIHMLPDQMRVAYRCFDRDQAQVLRLSELDYYAEAQIQALARQKGYTKLYLGNDHHPVSQLGLSVFKLRVGARPVVSPFAEDVAVEEQALLELAHVHGLAGYYSDPVDTFYTRFHLYGTEGGVIPTFLTVAKQAGIEVVRQ